MGNRRHRWTARRDAGDAFFPEPGEGPVFAPDDLAEELAEEFLASALTGQYQAADAHDQIVDEEDGGPFIPSSERREFARGGEVVDAEYELEAFPTSSSSAETPAKPRY